MIKTLLDVLLIDDNPADIELTLLALRENHLANKVKVLKDGEAAIDYIFGQGKYSDFDICEGQTLILLDIGLPKIDGIEILRRMRSDERRKNLPVIVLTSSESDQDRIESYHLGVNAYLVKPIEFASFTHAVIQVGYYWAVLSKPPY